MTKEFGDLERCGLGTPWGCKEVVDSYPGVVLLHGREPIVRRHGGYQADDGSVMFHRDCVPWSHVEVVERDWQGRRRDRVC